MTVNYEAMGSAGAVARRAAAAIHKMMHAESLDTILIGSLLATVRKKTSARVFNGWFRVEFGWTPSVASNFLQANAMFGHEDPNVMRKICRTAIFMLVRTDAAVAAAALDMAKAGQYVSTKDVRSIMKKAGVGLRGATAGKARKPRTAEAIVKFLEGVVQTAHQIKMTPVQRRHVLDVLEHARKLLATTKRKA